MAVAIRNTFARNISTGPMMELGNRLTSLEFNLWNMKVGRLRIGSAKWFGAMMEFLKDAGFSELDGIKLYRGKPWFLRGKQSLLAKAWYAFDRTHPNRKRRGSEPQFSHRVTRAMKLLKRCPRSRLSFVTIVCNIALTKEEALNASRAAGAKLDGFIRRRFDNAIWMLFPEVDLKLAGNVADGLLVNSSWVDGIDDTHLVYKVHFHGIMYVPDMSPSEVEKAFRFHRNGKRNKAFSGVNQVRAIAVRDEPGRGETDPDVMGCIGYSTKCHYRPPTTVRMLEGFAEWLWLTDKIMSDPSLIRIGGVNKGITYHCEDCGACHIEEGECNCQPVIEALHDFYDDKLDSEVSSVPVPGSDISLEEAIDLNSLSSSFWVRLQNQVLSKSFTAMGLVVRFAVWITRISGQIRGP